MPPSANGLKRSRNWGWLANDLAPLRWNPIALPHQGLSDYKHDETPGRSLELVFTVKHQKQRALNRVMRERLYGRKMKALGEHTPRSYRDGLLPRYGLECGTFQFMDMQEPFGLDHNGASSGRSFW